MENCYYTLDDIPEIVKTLLKNVERNANLASEKRYLGLKDDLGQDRMISFSVSRRGRYLLIRDEDKNTLLAQVNKSIRGDKIGEGVKHFVDVYFNFVGKYYGPSLDE